MRTRAASTHLSSPNLSILGVGGSGGRGGAGHSAQAPIPRVKVPPARNSSTNAPRDKIVPNPFLKKRQDSSGGLSALMGKQMVRPVSHHLDFRQNSLEANSGLRIDLPAHSQLHSPHTPNPTPQLPLSRGSPQQLFPLLAERQLQQQRRHDMLELGPFCGCGYRIALCNAPPLLPHTALTTPGGCSMAAVVGCGGAGGGGSGSGDPSPAGSAVTCPGGGLLASSGSGTSCIVNAAGGQPRACPLCYARSILDEQRRLVLAGGAGRGPPGGSACTCSKSPKKRVGCPLEINYKQLNITFTLYSKQ